MDVGDLQQLRHYFNRCRPEVPVPADDPERWYVDFDSLGLRGERCISTAASTIELAEDPTCQLFTGFSGSGKTSELRRLIRILEENRYFVVYADALRSIDVQNEIEYSDVLIALGLATDNAIDVAKNIGSMGQWRRRFADEVKTLLFADVSMSGLKEKVSNNEIGVELKENFSFRKAMRQAAHNRRRQLLDEVRRFFHEANEFVKKMSHPNGLVVILDNLEKLSSSPDVQDSAKTMFINHTDALRAPGVHLIYTPPARVVFSKIGPQLGKLYDGEPLVLPMVKFNHRQSGEPFAAGRAAMRELLLRRLDALEVFGGRLETVDALVARSGGYMRDLLRLAQYSLQHAQSLPITTEHVAAAVAKLKRSYIRGYSTAFDDLLTYIAHHRPMLIPSGLTEPLEEVIDGHFAMIYGNNEDWYDVHPLVLELQQEETAAKT